MVDPVHKINLIMKELQFNKYNLILGFLILSVIRIYGIESDSSLINKYTNNNFINWFSKNAKAFEINNDEIKKGTSFFNCKERYMVFNNLALQYVDHAPLNAEKLLLKSLERKLNFKSVCTPSKGIVRNRISFPNNIHPERFI